MDPVDVDVTTGEEEPEQLVAKEMYDAEYTHIHAVKGPAHAMKFVVIKAQTNEPDYEAVMKAKYTAEQQRAMLSKGQAMKGPDGEPSYPIGDVDDLDRAIHAVGRGGKDHDAIRRYIIGRANALSKSDMIPENWAADGSLKEESVKKAAEQQTTEPEVEKVKKADGDLDASELLAEPDGGVDGSSTAPSSEAWERVDAATARKWTAILSRARAAVSLLFDRENQEAALGSDDDVEDAWNLEDAACAIDYAISCLAPFAVDEEAEADAAAEAMGVAKAMIDFKEADLNLIESLAPVKKAGRVLSAANEQAIRDAVSSLQKVLASLPAAPAEVAKALKAKGKKNELDVAVKAAADDKSTEAKAEVTKAKGDPMVPVYDANGKLCGMVDATDIVPIADAPGADKEPAPAPAEDGKEVAGAQPAAAAQPAGEPNGAAAAAPAEQPAEQQAVAKSQLPQTPEELAALVRSEIEKAVKARDEEHGKVVKSLEGRVHNLEQQPAPKTPLLGPVPLGGMQQVDGQHLVLRGQGQPEGDPELERIQKALEVAKDPVEIAQLLQEKSTRMLAIALGKK